MNDENTNGSQNSMTEAEATSASTDQSSSTTEQSQQTDQPKADADKAAEPAKEGGTILTDGAKEGDDGQQTDAGKDEGEPDPRAAFYGAPEGDYELDLGEGVEIDAEALADVAPIAKELNLSAEGLGKLAGVYAEKVLPRVAQSIVSQMENDVVQQRADWATQTKLAISGGKDAEGNVVEPDPDFKGARFDEVVATSHKAIRKLGGDEFAQFLEDTGLGNDPRMVKFAFRAGTALSEDTTFERGGAASKPKSPAEVFYGGGS